MTNLQISDNDLIGNKFNGHDLHLYLRKKNIQSNSMVFNKQSKDENTYLLSGNRKYRNAIYDLEKAIECYYSIHALSSPFPIDVINSKLFLEADTVHLHLIHNYIFNLNYLPLMSRLKPVIWSVHDPWPVTGHCIHPFGCSRWQIGCGNCERLDTPFSMELDNTALNWELKRIAINNSQLDVIVASKWMEKILGKSPMFENARLHRIPFGLDQNIFNPGSKPEARKRLGIPMDSLVIAFRSDKSEFKGMNYIDRALDSIGKRKNVTVLSLAQKGNLEKYKGRIKIIEYGWIFDDKVLADVYRSSDLFLMPSKAESFGMMAIESMSCGTPVLTINGTSLSDVVFAGECGVSTSQDVDEYAREFTRLIGNREEMKRRGFLSSEIAKKEYNSDIYTERIIKVYEEAISRHKSDPYAERLMDNLKAYCDTYEENSKSKASYLEILLAGNTKPKIEENELTMGKMKSSGWGINRLQLPNVLSYLCTQIRWLRILGLAEYIKKVKNHFVNKLVR